MQMEILHNAPLITPGSPLITKDLEKKEGMEAFDDEFFEFDQDLCDCVLQSSLLDCD